MTDAPRAVARWVEWLPVVAAVLLEWANVSQIWRMWTQHTAAGQSLIGWLSVGVAITLYWYYYRAKGLVIPMYTMAFGICLNAGVWSSVLYFRYLA